MWTINKNLLNKYPKKYHKIAVKDMIVYKVGYKYKSSFLPFYRGWDDFEYEPQQINVNIDLCGQTINDEYRIKYGYHSYLGKCCCQIDNASGNDRIVKYGDSIRAFEIILYTVDMEPLHEDLEVYKEINNSIINIGKFIIPANTEYYVNYDGEIVSSNIIWTGESHMLSSFNQNMRKDIKTLWDKCHKRVITKKIENNKYKI